MCPNFTIQFTYVLNIEKKWNALKPYRATISQSSDPFAINRNKKVSRKSAFQNLPIQTYVILLGIILNYNV